MFLDVPTVVFTLPPSLGRPKGVLVMSAVPLGQCEHNNRALVRTKTAVLSAVRKRALGTVVELWCSSFLLANPIQLYAPTTGGTAHVCVKEASVDRWRT